MRALPRPALVAAVAGSLCLAAACGSGSSGDRTAGTPPTRAGTTSTSAAPSSTATPTTTAPPDLATVRVRLTEVASGLDSPVALAWRANDDRMYVAEQVGRVRIVDGGTVQSGAVLSIDVSHGNEQGLLGLAFSADGSHLYVDYTDPAGDTHVVEYGMNGDRADTATRRELLSVDQPFANHNGGQVTFGPDGALYIGLGDGGSAGDPRGNGQNLGTLLGKILRIDPRAQGAASYTVPGDNPFVGQNGRRPEIWMYGLRNPWRFSFDRATKDLWIGDVGQNAFEEIDFAAAGESGINWGWNAREGLHAYQGGTAPAGARDPVIELSHEDGNCSITGGDVYRGAAVPALRGVYVYADFCGGTLLAAVQAGGRVTDQRDLGVDVDSPTTFGEDPAGEVYVASRDGSVYRIAAA